MIGKRISGVVEPRQVLAVASYPVRLSRAPTRGCRPGQVLRQMPRDGALIQLIEYTPSGLGNKYEGLLSRTPSRPARFDFPYGSYVSYECFGPSYQINFKDSGRIFSAQAWMNRARVDPQTRVEALQILDSLKLEGRPGGNRGRPSKGRVDANVRPGTRLYLAGDRQLTVVDVKARTAWTLKMPLLSGGDPPYRIVRRGNRLVIWNWKATYALDASFRSSPRSLGRSRFFIPSSRGVRVWLAVVVPKRVDPKRYARRRIKAVREVTPGGRVTVPGVRPPGGRWPLASVGDYLAFESKRGISVWDPATRKVKLRLPPYAFAGAVAGSLLTWCNDDSGALHVTDVPTDQEFTVKLPPGFAAFNCTQGAFSPDAKSLAVPVVRGKGPLGFPAYGRAPQALAIVDLKARTANVVRDSRVSAAGYVFVAWASSGRSVFMSGGDERREIIEYRLGRKRAERLDLRLKPFYAMAAN